MIDCRENLDYKENENVSPNVRSPNVVDVIKLYKSPGSITCHANVNDMLPDDLQKDLDLKRMSISTSSPAFSINETEVDVTDEMKEQATERKLTLANRCLNGFSNMGATCYLSSLLQGIFHCDSFIKNLFKINNTEEDNLTANIVAELKVLLIMTKIQVKIPSWAGIEIDNLLELFGWSDEEAFQQQDVQEFKCLLFDEFSKSKDPKIRFLSDNFEGIIETCICCTNCNSSKFRQEKFQEIGYIFFIFIIALGYCLIQILKIFKKRSNKILKLKT